MIADDSGAAQVSYTYDPFGVVIEENGTFANPFKFTGQWYDEEIDQYYLRARMYDPALARFTGRDPVLGRFREPMTLHRYLYCKNDPINQVDPNGFSSISTDKYDEEMWSLETWDTLWNNKPSPGDESFTKSFITSFSSALAGHYAPADPGLSAIASSTPELGWMFFYTSLRNGMINAVISEFAGEKSYLYDYQDYILDRKKEGLF